MILTQFVTIISCKVGWLYNIYIVIWQFFNKSSSQHSKTLGCCCAFLNSVSCMGFFFIYLHHSSWLCGLSCLGIWVVGAQYKTLASCGWHLTLPVNYLEPLGFNKVSRFQQYPFVRKKCHKYESIQSGIAEVEYLLTIYLLSFPLFLCPISCSFQSKSSHV